MALQVNARNGRLLESGIVLCTGSYSGLMQHRCKNDQVYPYMYFTKGSYEVSILIPCMLLQSFLSVKNSHSIPPKSGCYNWNFLLLLLSIVMVENRQFSSAFCQVLMDFRTVAMFHHSFFLQAKREHVLQTSDCSCGFPNIPIFLAAE